jgi:hypothetical protein
MAKKSLSLLMTVVMVLVFASCGRGTELIYDEPLPPGVPVEYDGAADDDGDGLSNDEELAAGTSMYSCDTDGDTLNDKNELEAGTDPLKWDTDGDGLSDGAELTAGLDPLKKKTDGKTADQKVQINVTAEIADGKVSAEGNANINEIYFEEFTTSGLQQHPGIIGAAYEIFLPHEFTSAVLEIAFDEYDIAERGSEVENLSIFQFTNDGEFVEVPSKIDVDAGIVSADLTHFSKYILMDKTKVESEDGSQVMLLIDNSGSMYSLDAIPEEQRDATGFDENDPDFKRIDMANALIDMADEHILFGAAKFTKDYTLLSEISADEKKLHEQLNAVKTVEETFNGTYIAASINRALDSFDEDDFRRKFIVLLTDGATTESDNWFSSLFSIYDSLLDEAIANCKLKNVTVICVGLGKDVDVDYLKNISAATGGIYLHASNDAALDEIHKAILGQLNYGLEDLDGDGKNDRLILADSGFDPARNGFSFPNYCYNDQDGQCYGLAAFAQQYYLGRANLTGARFSTRIGGPILGQDAAVPGYNISGLAFFQDGKQDLFSYTNPITDELRAVQDMEKESRRILDGKTLRYSEEAFNNVTIPYFEVREIPISGKWGKGSYTSIEQFIINSELDKDQNPEDPIRFFEAVFWYYCLQNHSDEYVTKSDFGTYETGYDFLYSKISEGIPAVIQIPGHAVNGIRLLRDIEDPTTLILETYDSNFPGERTPYRIERKKLLLYDKLSIENIMAKEKYMWKYTVYNEKGDTVRINYVDVINARE